ncbi:MAG: hypothetical protein HDT36_03650, partial [Clostridiales bacterium]|nr:hypothetical protein [Clostridiales bacterium]
METKFFEKFVEMTNGQFPMLKLNGATYSKAETKLTVRFIISALVISSFDENKKTAVLETVQKLFPGVKVEVQYIRTYADYSLVKNKITDFLNSSNKILLSGLADDNLIIDIGEEDINIKFKLKSHLYNLLNAGDLKGDLIDCLDRSFNYNINLSTEELPDSDDDNDFELTINTTSDIELGDLRLVDIALGDKLYSRGRIGNTAQLPSYICDVKGDADNIVLCGKVSNVSSRTYTNKKYDPNDPKKGPQELPMLRFMLDDGTAKMDTVCFPKPEDADRLLLFLNGAIEKSTDSAQASKVEENSEAKADDNDIADGNNDAATSNTSEASPADKESTDKVEGNENKAAEQPSSDKEVQKEAQTAAPMVVQVVCFGKVS